MKSTRTVSQIWQLRRYGTTSGPHGVDGRSPRVALLKFQVDQPDNQISITDPYVLYKNHISRGTLKRDEAQIRAMKEFQKLYYRVVNYRPTLEISVKIQLLLKKLEVRRAQQIVEEETSGNIRLFKLSTIQNLFRKDAEAEKHQLIKIMTDEEELSTVASPQGLLLNGEVGCGKSMLMDIFAESLPHHSKMRWHYNNFILWVYNEMHAIQNEKLFTSSVFEGLLLRTFTRESEFILFEIAQKMINKSTILMLDEFMLPDVAAAHVVKILFTYYFKLGGVLVATSNRLPEDLYSTEFHKKHFQSFTKILHLKCHSVDMNSQVDYRILNSRNCDELTLHLVVKRDNKNHQRQWEELIMQEISDETPISSSIEVYGRSISIPETYKSDTCCVLDFDHICGGLHSSSDYITLASKYSIIILDNIPQLKLKMKNEARRFITLIDAIYEAKCQLYIRSEVPVDEMFFPDAEKDMEEARIKVQQEEMFAKTVLDLEAPYRPNVSEYNTDYKGVSPDTTQTRNFTNVNAFTGEDEKFAYKRAVLRMEEMLNSSMWRDNLWVPLDATMRPWEKNASRINNEIELYSDGKVVGAKLINSGSFSVAASAPRPDAPVIREHHIWKMGYWTRENGKRLKDQIAKKWLLLGVRDEVQNFHRRVRDE